MEEDNTQDENTVTITVQTTVKAPLDAVWDYWTNPQHIPGWAFASDSWEASSAENHVWVGGAFKTVMAAKDKSNSFDFEGTYTEVEKYKLLEYDLEDWRHVKIVFAETPEGVQITETFEPEDQNPADMQQAGWQAILNNFKKYAETKVSNQ